jgi:hypothetical protein
MNWKYGASACLDVRFRLDNPYFQVYICWVEHRKIWGGVIRGLGLEEGIAFQYASKSLKEVKNKTEEELFLYINGIKHPTTCIYIDPTTLCSESFDYSKHGDKTITFGFTNSTGD